MRMFLRENERKKERQREEKYNAEGFIEEGINGWTERNRTLSILKKKGIQLFFEMKVYECVIKFL